MVDETMDLDNKVERESEFWYLLLKLQAESTGVVQTSGGRYPGP